MSKDLNKVAAEGTAGGKKKGGDMSSAISGTEAIRTWDDHRIGIQGLATRLETDVK
jgi:hypothetical protein